MFVQITWNSGTDFTCEAGNAHIHASASSPKNHKTQLTPFELFLSSLASSTGIEMVRYLKKNDARFENLSISVTGHMVSKYQTKIFSSIDMVVKAETKDDASRILNAVEMSQYATCGISAMISKSIPINWRLEVNGEVIGEGIPNFEEPNENVW